MKNSLSRMLCAVLLAVCSMNPNRTLAAEDKGVDQKSRCAVCGMFVAKYPEWVCRVTMSDGSVHYFDGVKDMMAFTFAPQKYGATAGATPSGYVVKDYYTLAALDGKLAFYVVGSDTMGPMGMELIPFDSKEAAEAFSKDHHGKSIVPFASITAEMVESMRTGQTMK